jgi:hypothetical protein
LHQLIVVLACPTADASRAGGVTRADFGGDNRTILVAIDLLKDKSNADKKPMQANNNTRIAVVPAEARAPEYLRIPHAKERDPLFGLTRTQLYELILPSVANDWTPPVRSAVLRRPGAKSGVRLIHVGSLRAYVEQHLEPASQPPGAAVAGANAAVALAA